LTPQLARGPARLPVCNRGVRRTSSVACSGGIGGISRSVAAEGFSCWLWYGGTRARHRRARAWPRHRTAESGPERHCRFSFAQGAETKGIDVTRQPLYGGHCAVDIASVATRLIRY
jgi:hypothetical protein